MEFIPVKECGNYLVSKEGKVFSLLTMKEIKTFKLKLGYYAFEMRINGKRKVKYLHRALAELFVENPNNKPNVNHIDGVKTNNNIENLEWVTQKENIVHAWKTGLSKTTEKSRERCRQMGLSHSKEKRTQIASLGGKASADRKSVV